jgi:hypothetical protein
MAEPAAMRQIFVCLGFPITTAKAIFNKQGITGLSEMRLLLDDDVESLCRALCYPGGQIEVDEEMVNNPGNHVPLKAEQNMKLACYWLRHLDQTSQTTAIASITAKVVQTTADYKAVKAQKQAVKPPMPIINARDWPATVNAITKYLQAVPGSTGVPLAYVI